MATPAQIAANRANAQRSTGPRSVEGKSVSRFNGLKSGLYAKSLVVPGEDAEELEALAESTRRTYQPMGQAETDLVDQLIESTWMQRRYARLEAEVLNRLMSDQSLPKDALLGAAFAKDFEGDKMLKAVLREKHAANREWHKAFNAFLRLQDIRLRAMKAETDAVVAAHKNGFDLEDIPTTAPNWVRSSNQPATPAASSGLGPRPVTPANAAPPKDDRALRL